jgi:hypothetical protein
LHRKSWTFIENSIVLNFSLSSWKKRAWTHKNKWYEKNLIHKKYITNLSSNNS